MRLIATIDDPGVVGRILRHLGLPSTIPLPAPARAPPEPSDTLDPSLHA
jgi:hypothetical protein